MARSAARGPRIAIATRLYAPEASAAAFRIEALARGLARSGAEVTVLSTRPPRGTALPAATNGVVVRRWPVLRDRTGNVRGYLPYASFDVPALVRLLLTRSDVIVAEAPPTTGLVALIAARLRRVPLVYYPGDIWTDALAAMHAPRPVTALTRWMESRVARGSARTLGVSAEVSARLIELGAPAARVVTVGNGVDTATFTPEVAAVTASRPYFVYTGTMSEWQRPEIFVQALAALETDAVDIVFLGQGTAEDAVRAAAAELAPGRVRLLGVVPPGEAARWIRGAAGALVSIVPGIGYDLARPTKTYAAAAVGTPVLYTGADTGAEVVRQADLGRAVGFDAHQIAAAMAELLRAQADGTTERERARRAAWARENVSLEVIGDRAAQVVRSALRSTGRSGRRRPPPSPGSSAKRGEQ